jgi:hypothetical protein
MKPLTSTAQNKSHGGKNMKQRLLVLAAALGLSANVVAQDFYGIYRETSDNGDLRELGQEDLYSPGQPQTVPDGVLGTTGTVAFGWNTNFNTDSGIRVTATYSDQQYEVNGDDTGGSNHPSMLFGAQSNNSVKALTGEDIFVRLSNVSVPSDSYYSPTPASIGTGMTTTTSWAFEQYVSTEALRQIQEDNPPSAPVDASFYMGKLTYTFSQPVDYPILHVTGLGGFVSTDYVPPTIFPGLAVSEMFFAVDLELDSVSVGGGGASSNVLSRLSGTTYTTLESDVRIKNNFTYEDSLLPGAGTGTEANEAGTGSFLVVATGVTSVTFNVYMVGKNETATGASVPALWSTVDGDPNPKYSGDRFNTSWTLPLNDPTAVAMGNVDLLARDLPAFLSDLGTGQMASADLLALLRSWDPDIAANLDGADTDLLQQALRDYLDPDGDGQVVVLVWETQEQRGTVGFFAERSQGGTWTPVNTKMLPALIAAPMGAQYWLVDPGVQLGDDAQYRLIEVEATGQTNKYGPFDLRAIAP